MQLQLMPAQPCARKQDVAKSKSMPCLSHVAALLTELHGMK